MTGKLRFVQISDYYRSNPFGYYLSKEKAEDAITSYELATSEKFVTTRSRIGQHRQEINNSKSNDKKHYKIWWDLKAFNYNIKDFDGIPYTIEHVQKRECQQGPDRMKKESKMKKNRSVKIKSACPACVHLREVTKYTQFKVDEKTPGRCEYQSKKLRDCLNNNRVSLQIEKRWYVEFPTQRSHKYHQGGSNYHYFTSIHSDVEHKLEAFYQEDPNQTLSVLHKRLEFYVTKELFYQKKQPSKTDRYYFPIQRDIKNYVFLRNNDSQSYVFDGLPNCRPTPIMIDIDVGSINDGYVEGDVEMIAPTPTTTFAQEGRLSDVQQDDVTVHDYQQPQQAEIVQLPNGQWYETVTVADGHSNGAVGMVNDSQQQQQTYLLGEEFDDTQLVEANENGELVEMDYGTLINSEGLVVGGEQYHTLMIGLDSEVPDRYNQPLESDTIVFNEDELLNSFTSQLAPEQLTPEQLNNYEVQFEAIGDSSRNNVGAINDGGGNSIARYFCTIVDDNGEQVMATNFVEQPAVPGCSGSSVS